MEPRPNFHPVYVSGQYLTSEHLNETQNFLWSEEKATRTVLAGDGIVSGLHADFSGTALLEKATITRGSASTIDGYIIQNAGTLTFDRGVGIQLSLYTMSGGTKHLLTKTEFDKIKTTINPVSETVLEATELLKDNLTTEELPDGAKGLNLFNITTSQALSNYIVLAWVFVKDAENNHCQQGDCNTKGIQRNYEIRYFLLLNTAIPALNALHEEQQTCGVARIKNLSTTGSTTGLNSRSFSAWSTSVGELQPYFSNSNPLKQLSRVAELLGTAEQTAVSTSNTRFAQIVASVTAANCPQYYNGFASDLSKAINELILFYNKYASKYPKLSADRIQSVVVAGSLRFGAGIDKWRYYYIPATEQIQYISEKKKLRRLLFRVVALVNNFVLQANIISQAAKVNKILAIPSNIGEGLLQNAALPYYYDVLTNNTENDILKYWNPQGGSLKNVFCYYDAIITTRSDMSGKLVTADWQPFNFFRIEGHIGMTKASAISAISNLIFNEGLPIQLIDCDITYTGPKKWHDWYGEFTGNVTLWIKNLRENYKVYDYTPLKIIEEKIKQTSYRNVNEVTKIANDFYAYSNVFYKTTPKTPRAGDPVPKGIPGDAYVRFKSIVPENQIISIYDKYKEAVAEQTELQAQKLIVFKDLVDLEYMGGAPRGGTFVLLHNGGTVIGDGCLPYYYRINQLRVFSK